VEDGSQIPNQMKAAQHQLLPSLKSDLISVSYQLEVRVVHSAGMGLIDIKKEDIPSIFFPVNIVMNPRGQFEQVQIPISEPIKQQNQQMYQQPMNPGLSYPPQAIPAQLT
jgi:hypothetical protein